MLIYKRLITFSPPFYLGGFFYLLVEKPDRWLWWSLGVLIITAFLIAALLNWRVWTKKYFLTFIPVGIFLAANIGFYFFLNYRALTIIWPFLIILLISIYFEISFVFFYQPQRYIQLSLPNFSLIVNTFSAFSLSSLLFALQFIALLPRYVVPLTIFIFTIIIMQQGVWVHKIVLENKKALFFTNFFTALIMAEMAWTLMFWPTAYFINGAVMGIVFYCLPTLIQLELRQALTRRRVIRYGIISSVALISVLVTAQWI